MSKPTRASHPIFGLLPMEVEGLDSVAELALDMRWSWKHAAFAVLERALSFMEETGQSFEVVLAVR
jgi:hypothetical protein